MTAYIAQLECAQSTQAEPASFEGEQKQGVPHQSNRNVSNPEVLKAKEDRAKLQGFIVTAGNLDEQRAEGPRPVTPLRAVSAAQLPLVRICREQSSARAAHGSPITLHVAFLHPFRSFKNSFLIVKIALQS